MPDTNEKLQKLIDELRKLSNMFKRRTLLSKHFSKGEVNEIERRELLNDLYSFVAKHTEVTKTEELMAAFKKDQEEKEKQEKVDALKLKALGIKLLRDFRGIVVNPYYLPALEEFQKSFTELKSGVTTLSFETNKTIASSKLKDLEEKMKSFEIFLANAKKVETKIELDTSKVSLLKLDNENLVAGLQNFYSPANIAEVVNYRNKLREGGYDELNSFAKAAVILFKEKDAPGIKGVEEFLLFKKVGTNYPSNQMGIFYRADNRLPDKLKADGGFKGKTKTLTINEARAQIKEWFGPPKMIAGQVPGEPEKKTPSSPSLYHTGWVRGKAKGDKIATGNDMDCMSYGATVQGGSNYNVYKININGLSAVVPTEEALGVEPHPDVEKGNVPTLLMNAETVDAATVIAVQGMGNSSGETTFFTSIPMNCIEHIYEVIKENNKIIKKGWV